MLIVYVYMLVALVTGVSAMLKGAFWPGLVGALAPIECVLAAGGVRGSLAVGTRSQKIGGLIAGTIGLAIGLVLLYVTGYHVILFGLDLTGAVWGAIGALLGLVFTPGNFGLRNPGQGRQTGQQ